MLTKLKHILLKIIDLTALGFLEPIVRLCYGEEPRVQLKKIGQFVVLPVLAFMVFLAIWTFVAPRHKTNYGSVPTPGQAWAAYRSAMTFHDRETAKGDAYVAEGEARETMLAYAQGRKAELDPLLAEADAAVKVASDAYNAQLATVVDPLREQVKTMQTEAREQKKVKEAALKAKAETLADDAGAREAYLAELIAFRTWEKEQRELQAAVKAQISQLEKEEDPTLAAAIAVQTKYAEEAQFIGKLIELSGDKGREMKIAALAEKLQGLEAEYAAASGDDAYKVAKKIAMTQSLVDKNASSTYAKPWSLPRQIIRSILCVFAGFFVGVAIAVPIGVCCGLSPIFMSMMTPFIALFKPVSPIVWLLVLWIIVGGFFVDPNNSPVLDAVNWIVNGILAWIPYVGSTLGDADINPAFIASALTVSMCSLWATLVNTALGVASVDKDHINVARVLKLGFFSRLFKIVLPSALPLMFAGMRISLGVGWMVLIAAELLASSEGLGKYVNDMFQNGDFTPIVAIVFVVGIIGLLLDRIMIVFQRAVSFEGSVATV